MHLAEDAFDREVIFVFLQETWLFVDLSQNLTAQVLCHLLHPLNREVSVAVNVESLWRFTCFDPAQVVRYLAIERELKPDLGLAAR